MYAPSRIQSKFLTSVSVCWWARCNPWEFNGNALRRRGKICCFRRHGKTPLRNASRGERHFRSRKRNDVARTRPQTLRAYVHCKHPVCTRGNPFAMATEVASPGLCLTKAPAIHVPRTASRKRHFESPPRNSASSHSRLGEEEGTGGRAKGRKQG